MMKTFKEFVTQSEFMKPMGYTNTAAYTKPDVVKDPNEYKQFANKRAKDDIEKQKECKQAITR